MTIKELREILDRIEKNEENCDENTEVQVQSDFTHARNINHIGYSIKKNIIKIGHSKYREEEDREY